MSKRCKKRYKKTRRKYTRKEKINILNKLECSGCSVLDFSKKINIPTKTLQNWNQNKEKILATDKKNLNKQRIGAGEKPSLNNNIESKLLDWILDLRYLGLPVTDDLITSRAKYVKNEMNIKTDCNFTNGWLENFKNRHNLVSRRGGSKIVRSNDCELSEIIKFVKLVHKKIVSGKYSSIVNIDEMGICFDPKPSSTLDTKGVKRVDIKTTGRDKQRITIVLGIDLLNNIKINPLLIFKGKTKRCLYNIPLSNSYELGYQQNSWCYEKQFINFLSFLPKDKKILLLYDNFKGHKTKAVNDYIKKELPLVKVLLLPPNTTSILQPLDVGINKPFKAYIKKKYMEWIIQYVNDYKIIPKLIMKERKKLLVTWVSESWKNINDTMIKKSFEECGYTTLDKIDASTIKYFNV
jgi:DDE superfamily endonuclease/Tc5 transposase DNA-binding domain/CENP-B N-terminal DNA-binding domain